MSATAATHRGIIRTQLAADGLSTAIEPVWDALRPGCASDEECAARVLLSLYNTEIRDIRKRLQARPPQIEPAVAMPLLASYDRSVSMATADLQRATAGSGIVVSRVRRADDCDDDGGEYARPHRHYDSGWWTD